jgi:hypothetical protein
MADERASSPFIADSAGKLDLSASRRVNDCDIFELWDTRGRRTGLFLSEADAWASCAREARRYCVVRPQRLPVVFVLAYVDEGGVETLSTHTTLAGAVSAKAAAKRSPFDDEPTLVICELET